MARSANQWSADEGLPGVDSLVPIIWALMLLPLASPGPSVPPSSVPGSILMDVVVASPPSGRDVVAVPLPVVLVEPD